MAELGTVPHWLVLKLIIQ